MIGCNVAFVKRVATRVVPPPDRGAAREHGQACPRHPSANLSNAFEHSLEAAIRAAQERNGQKADRAIHVNCSETSQSCKARFGVEPKRRGRPLGSREAPSKGKAPYLCGPVLEIPKIAILRPLANSPRSDSFTAWLIAQLQKSKLTKDDRSHFSISRLGDPGYTHLPQDEREKRLIRELRDDGDSLERLRRKEQE